jgi:S-adenosylmethionine:tRNA ribosyltransferase-isomerase
MGKEWNDPRRIAIGDLTYHLPEDRIAQYPLARRDEAKLLVHREGINADHHFNELPDLLPQETVLVLNDTRVVHARVRFRRATGALVECMVLSPDGNRPLESALNDGPGTRWWCMVGNAKRWKGEELSVEREGRQLSMHRLGQADGEHLVAFNWTDGGTFLEQLDHFGTVPLPPYMRRMAEDADDARYNTVFAAHPGSVAAPTASLHFTPELMQRMEQRGIGMERVTLHVGAGTFLPVKSATMQGHAMHSEQLRIPRHTVAGLLAQLDRGPIVPVGTTAMRTIESLYWHGADLVNGTAGERIVVDQWRPYRPGDEVPVADALQAALRRLDADGQDALTGATTLLIAPGYRFRIATGLITNFHQPCSTLLLLVAALVGPQWRTMYAHALQHGYRFLSYGDGSLLWGDPQRTPGR